MGGFGNKDGAILRNLSQSGLSCMFEVALEEGSEVKIRTRLPALPEEDNPNYDFEALGIVVRCEPVTRPTSRHRFDIAVYFSEISDHDLALLQRFLTIRHSQEDV